MCAIERLEYEGFRRVGVQFKCPLFRSIQKLMSRVHWTFFPCVLSETKLLRVQFRLTHKIKFRLIP